ncbi:Alpha/beta hydrolase fold-1 - like 10 [Theobroma cacao]|uniref:Methyl esterase 10, putative n=1 Tax=Theobroma cacao TaxID=3641 RepID=A0A061DMW1_THECC|nr:Methyl esterase 10, putative [Theobroma cacao]WRX11122.1 Alpha/beta hydrolase fold-1 - like 10 [Theobroma cacao]
MKHFVLVHGMCHGAWCWYKLVSLLKSAGHRVTALDLGASGINPRKISELTSMSDYAQPLMEFMASLPQEEKVILVGHSFGGISMSLAMESYPNKILAAVYLTAFMPNHDSPPGTGVEEFFKSVMAESIMDFQLSFDEGPNHPPTGALFGPNYMVAKVYQLSPKEDLELAKTVLRPGKWFMNDLSKESLLTKEKFGSVNRVFIVCNEDLLIKESLQKWYIEHSRTDDVKVIAGADHMPMFSKPKELCQCLQEIAEKYN